ncbi:unnamed protein product [Schistocephalus solidus]|uniref:Uncharacterized protein n=1 Tax=Schistocephalus solidus TaxID=70667 RepID=A0A3P7D2B5_SCHSO|nr:unnamed protein product [Schistocephalus solidus]
MLERVKEIFERSPGNYFVLDKHHLISSITEVIPSKPDCVQEFFFSIFAFMVERMCYVPLQELNSVALLLRNCNQTLDAIANLSERLAFLAHSLQPEQNAGINLAE